MNILICGATSAIAQATLNRYAERASHVVLLARNAEKLAAVEADFKARSSADVSSVCIDLADHVAFAEAVAQAADQLKGFDLALVAQGSLPDQVRCESDIDYLREAMQVNTESVILCTQTLANAMQKSGRGVLAVIGSVAGDRGRASNFAYGSCKAAVEAYCSGLRARLMPSGVQVLLIKPGMVATPMTAGMDLPGPLVSSADQVAKSIEKAITKRRDVVYAPGYWALIMLVIRLLPGFIFKRLNF
ncbi:hypothetical protein FHR99_002781 [Litorivivens lipolytica]|uniref:Short-chain dehydrogenase n=1 Tax=Litorivivens lipolytica TaxID=1524264 RepID=A0A7W4W7Y6_9GAMM|nr:SDR family oxidoreductase [Litorivivens lipolytica]MBB3048507.1 hypothetical protein [Litorivivens lipolytica]